MHNCLFGFNRALLHWPLSSLCRSDSCVFACICLLCKWITTFMKMFFSEGLFTFKLKERHNWRRCPPTKICLNRKKRKAQNLKVTIIPPPFLFEHSVCFLSFLPLIHAYNYTPYLPFLSLSPLSAGDHNAAPPLDLKCPFAATIITSRRWGCFYRPLLDS